MLYIEDYNRPSSFRKLPIKAYKYTLKPEVGSNMKFRVIPSFISVKEGSDFNSMILPGTVFSFFLDKEYIAKGFQFVFATANGSTILYKKGFSKHVALAWFIRHETIIKLEETTGNGEMILSVPRNSKGEAMVKTDDFDTEFKTNKKYKSRDNFDDVAVEFKFYNYTGDLSYYLPDFGRRII